MQLDHFLKKEKQMEFFSHGISNKLFDEMKFLKKIDSKSQQKKPKKLIQVFQKVSKNFLSTKTKKTFFNINSRNKVPKLVYNSIKIILNQLALFSSISYLIVSRLSISEKFLSLLCDKNLFFSWYEGKSYLLMFIGYFPVNISSYRLKNFYFIGLNLIQYVFVVSS